jgi:hypothetical protein
MPATELFTPAPFDSLADLRREHLRLLRWTRDPTTTRGALPEPPDAVERFLDEVQAAGARLDDLADREAAQGILDYWTARLLTAAAGNGGPPATPRVLAPFDDRTVQRVVEAAEGAVAALPPEDQELARRVMLRLVRLSPEGREFEPTDAALADLLAVGDPARVGPILDRLTAAGVVRGGADSSGPKLVLRHEALTRAWGRYADWLDKRARFRDQVRYWERNGHSRGALIDGPLLSDALAYHDLSGAEQEYLRASRQRESRSKRVWQALFAVVLGLLAVAAVGWIAAVRKAGAEAAANEEVSRKSAALEAANRDLDVQHAAQLRKRMLANLSGRMLALCRLIRTFSSTPVRRDHPDKGPEVDARARHHAIQRWDDLEAEGNDLVAKLLEAEAKLGEQGSPSARQFEDLNTQFNDIEPEELARDQIKSLKDPTGGVRGKKPVVTPTPEVKALSERGSGLGQKVKELLLASGDQVVVSDLESMRALAYDFLHVCTDQIIEQIARDDYEAAFSLIGEFAVLYWGEVEFVRGTPVTQAMIDFRRQLVAFDDAVGAQLPESVKVKRPPPGTKKKPGGQVPDNWQRTVVAGEKDPLKSEVRKLRLDEPQKKRLLDALKRSRDRLHHAIWEELSEPIAKKPADPAAAY